MRASDEVATSQAGEGWASKLAEEAEARRSRRGQGHDMAGHGVQVVRLARRSRSSISNRVSADLSNA
jgi:hypothetical protein